MKSFFNRGTIVFFVACCILGGVYGLVSAYTKAKDPAELRKRARVGAHKNCVVVAKRTLTSRGEEAPDSAVEQYCTCAVGRALDAMTDQQVLDVDAGKTHTKDVLGDRYTFIVSSCVQEARSAAGMPMVPAQ